MLRSPAESLTWTCAGSCCLHEVVKVCVLLLLLRELLLLLRELLLLLRLLGGRKALLRSWLVPLGKVHLLLGIKCRQREEGRLLWPTWSRIQ